MLLACYWPLLMTSFANLRKSYQKSTLYETLYETLYDKAMTMYAIKLERGPGVLPEIVDDGASMSVESDGSVLPIGWVLQSAVVQRKNLTVAQKNYLTEVFQVGERTGQKADPTSVKKGNAKSKA